MFVAASLLRFHEIDAIPIGFGRQHLVVQSYYCLSKLLNDHPLHYKTFLEQPCEIVASELDSISSQSELREMFKLFDSTKFGIGIVEENDRPCALVSLRDLLGLYERDIISSPLSLGDVASPIFSLSADSTLRQALELMFQQRIRRVFIDKERTVISDRKIISYIFSSECLNDASKSDFDPLAAPLNKLDSIHPSFLAGTANMKEAAKVMSKEIEECLVCEKGIVTPWDVVMKPWILRKMTMKGS